MHGAPKVSEILSELLLITNAFSTKLMREILESVSQCNNQNCLAILKSNQNGSLLKKPTPVKSPQDSLSQGESVTSRNRKWTQEETLVLQELIIANYPNMIPTADLQAFSRKYGRSQCSLSNKIQQIKK